MAKETDDIFIACVSNDIGLADGNRHGPSPRLMAALTSEFSRGGRNVPLHLASQCHEISVRVEEIATGRPAMWLYAADNAIDSDLCGSYTAGWHHAGLWGGANFYNLVSREGRIAVKRGACVLME
jgi:hypothetical protein